MRERHAPSLGHALVLGLLHGPTELLPVSSSAHTTLIPWLAGWPYEDLDPELRKSFEVALHAGTALALLLRAPWQGPAGPPGGPALAEWHASRHGRVGASIGFLVAALIPPALAGYALGGQVEGKLGTPATISAGLLAGSIAMGAAEVGAQRAQKACPTRARGAPTFRAPKHLLDRPHNVKARSPASASARDGLALGVAQAVALIPGVSRSGATFAAARTRGFSREDADRLSWKVGLPVIAGATLLQGTRLARAGTTHKLSVPLAVGAAAAFLSTLASTTTLSARRRVSLLPACAVYRAALALVVVRRMRDNTG
jgi:undecaprenyl-diphosphatase